MNPNQGDAKLIGLLIGACFAASGARTASWGRRCRRSLSFGRV